MNMDGEVFDPSVDQCSVAACWDCWKFGGILFENSLKHEGLSGCIDSFLMLQGGDEFPRVVVGPRRLNLVRC